MVFLMEKIANGLKKVKYMLEAMVNGKHLTNFQLQSHFTSKARLLNDIKDTLARIMNPAPHASFFATV